MAKLARITQVGVEDGFRLRLRYDDGVEGVVDLRSDVETGSVFAPLRDPQVFARVAIGLGGRCLEWPGEVDLCADALWQQITGLDPLAKAMPAAQR